MALGPVRINAWRASINLRYPEKGRASLTARSVPALANPELEAGAEEPRHVIGLCLDSLPHGPRQPLEGLHVRQETVPLPLVRPDARDASVDEDTWSEPSCGAVHALVMAGVHEVALVLVAQEEPIEIREKADRWSVNPRTAQNGEVLAEHPSELSVDLQGGHLGLHAVPHLPRRPGGHVRPEGEVPHRRGAERAEIPSQQLGSGLVEWDLR